MMVIATNENENVKIYTRRKMDDITNTTDATNNHQGEIKYYFKRNVFLMKGDMLTQKIIVMNMIACYVTGSLHLLLIPQHLST
ncbi:22792_t:CDS:2 [Rhizophagus irregularis]|nr:22792_t:CDS:2 [Rhizophagus irregularis]